MNVNGVLFTAQAAGQQMERFGNGGSIMMLASVAGSRAIKVGNLVHNVRVVLRAYPDAGLRIGHASDVVRGGQVGRAPIGTQHGVRVGPEADSSELDQSWGDKDVVGTHLSLLTFCVPKPELTGFPVVLPAQDGEAVLGVDT